MLETTLEALRQTWTRYFDTILALLPRVLATSSVILTGWVMAALSRFVVRRLLGLARFDAIAKRSGVADLLVKAELPAASILAGSVVFWIVLLSFLLAGLQAL